MKPPPLDPDADDSAPSGPPLTASDMEHAITYLRMRAADAKGAGWREVPRIVLHFDPEGEFDRALRAFDSHLAQARWMTQERCRQLLRRSAPA